MDTSAVESMVGFRQRVRETDQVNRVTSRSLARNARRINFEDISNKLKVPTFDEMKVLSSSLKKNKNCNHLQRLRHGLSSCQENIDIFLNTEGALYALIGCATGSDALVQREALCVLVNVALGTETQCLEVANKAGAYLITLLSDSNPQIQDPVAWCIGNLCGEHTSVCEILQSQGVELSLLKLLSSYSPNVIQSAASALMHYVNTLPHRTSHVVNAEMCQQLIQALDGMESCVVEVGWCLFTLSIHEEACHKLVDHGIVQAALSVLERLLNHQSFNLSGATPLVRVLINCVAAVPGTGLQICQRNDQLVMVIRNLLYCPHAHLRTETLQLLANIINATTQDSITGEGIVEDLSLRSRLAGPLRSALAANFTMQPPDVQTFHG
ncbi:unnamed protein product, partial [Meganyctiphanes norvegica]